VHGLVHQRHVDHLPLDVWLDVYDGSRSGQRVPVPCPGVNVTWRGRALQVRTELAGDQVRITVQDIKGVASLGKN